MDILKELAKQAFADTNDNDLIEHYNEVMQELNQARVAMQYQNGEINNDPEFRHLVQVFIYQAIGIEAEMVRRGLAKKVDLTFRAGEE